MTFASKRTMAVTTTTALFTAALMGACAGKTTSSAPVAEADLPLQYAHAICDSIQGCCGQASYPYDPAGCVASLQAEVTKSLTKDRPASAVYDANAAGSCIAKVRGIVSACSDPTEGDRAIEDACSAVYVGTKKVGEACAQGADCAPNSGGRVHCEHFGAIPSGPPTLVDGGLGGGGGGPSSQCVLLKAPATGDACGGFSRSGPPPSVVGDCTSSRADNAFYCDFKTNTCQPRAAVGQPCASGVSNTCVAGSSCKGNVCVAAGGAGASCTFGDCATGFYCSGGLFTNSGTGTCTAKKNAGEACDGQAADACAHGRCSKGKCSAGSLATADVCAGANTKGSSGSGSGSSSGGSGSVSDGGRAAGDGG